jgi:hypothetical protein
MQCKQRPDYQMCPMWIDAPSLLGLIEPAWIRVPHLLRPHMHQIRAISFQVFEWQKPVAVEFGGFENTRIQKSPIFNLHFEIFENSKKMDKFVKT